MKNTLLILIDDDKKVIQEFNTVSVDTSYDYNKVYFVNENDLVKIESLKLFSDIDYEYTYTLNDEESTASLIILDKYLSDLKKSVSEKVNERHDYLRTVSKLNTIQSHEVNVDWLLNYWKEIEKTRNIFLSIINSSNTSTSLIDNCRNANIVSWLNN
jgi:ABC-type phosphate/phosphonate transport system substrate-binding protein